MSDLQAHTGSQLPTHGPSHAITDHRRRRHALPLHTCSKQPHQSTALLRVVMNHPLGAVEAAHLLLLSAPFKRVVGKERAKSGANVTDARTPWRMRAFCAAEPLPRPGGRAPPPGRRQGGRVAGHMCGERRSWRRSEGGAGEHCARAERSGARARLGRCVWEGHLSGRRAVAAPPTPLRRRRGKGVRELGRRHSSANS